MNSPCIDSDLADLALFVDEKNESHFTATIMTRGVSLDERQDFERYFIHKVFKYAQRTHAEFAGGSIHLDILLKSVDDGPEIMRKFQESYAAFEAEIKLNANRETAREMLRKAREAIKGTASQIPPEYAQDPKPREMLETFYVSGDAWANISQARVSAW